MNEVLYVQELKKIVKKNLSLTPDEIAMYYRVSHKETMEKKKQLEQEEKKSLEELGIKVYEYKLKNEKNIETLECGVDNVDYRYKKNNNYYGLLLNFLESFYYSEKINSVKVGILLSEYCEQYHKLANNMSNDVLYTDSLKLLKQILLEKKAEFMKLDKNNKNLIQDVSNIIVIKNKVKIK